MGDGMDGLAAAILLAGLAMVAGGGALFGLAGRRLASSRAAKGATHREAAGPSNLRRRRLAVGAFTLTGLAAGGLLAIGTFREDLLAPPPQIRLRTPPGYSDIRVFVLEDPGRGLRLEWQGGGMPGTGRFAEVSVPASGVVRIAAIRPEEGGRSDLDIVWGKEGFAGLNGGGEGPPGTGARSFAIVERVDAWANGPPPELPSAPAALGAYLLARENAAKPGGHPSGR